MYPMVYAIKFTAKAKGNDFVVPKLEGIWSFYEAKYSDITMENALSQIPRCECSYRLLIRLPEFVLEDMVNEASEKVKAKKQIPFLGEIEFYTMSEGKCVQILDVGPFDTELESLLKLKSFMDAHGHKRNGEHHEINLSDFRKLALVKLEII
jgi:hypothetical protein